MKWKSTLAVLAVVVLPAWAVVLSAEDDSRWLVPRGRVAGSELRIVWQFNLPIGKGEKLEQLLVFDNRLCALSDRNYLTCLNRNDGVVLFSSSVAGPDLPVAELQFLNGRIVTVVGEKLVEINAETGMQQSSTVLGSGAACAVARNDSFYYVAGVDKRLHVLKADNKVQMFEVAAESDSLITTVLAEQEYVIFGTKAGNVVCTGADRPRKLWQFDARDAVAGALIHDGTSVYFASRDTNVYRLELSSGKLVWKYQTQALLDSGPQQGKKAVYQRVGDIGLIALDKETGEVVWQVADGTGLAAESGDKAFAITKTGVLRAMDNVKKKELYSLDLGTVVKYATNGTDARIYIGDAGGRLACLEPAR